jgi:hypothetical protein
VPRVDPDDTTTDIADAITRDTTVPLVKVADRKSKVVGFSVTVNALAAILAVIDWMPGSGGLVIDPPPENVRVVGTTVVALTVVELTVVIVPVVAVKVVNAPVLGAVLPIGGGDASEVTRDK